MVENHEPLIMIRNHDIEIIDVTTIEVEEDATLKYSQYKK
jgi:hypothetical protein